MSQHDMDVANQGFPAFRADVNAALLALVTLSSGNTAPTTKFVPMLWADTSTANEVTVKQWDGTDWNSLWKLDYTTGTMIIYHSAASETVSGLVELATSAEGITGTDTGRVVTPAVLAAVLANFIDTAKTVGKAWGYAFEAVGYNSGSPTWDVSAMPAGALDMTGNPTIDASNIEDGKVYQLRVYHNGAARTITWASKFKFGDDGEPTLSTTSGKYDYLTFVGKGTTELHHMGAKTGY